MNRKLINVSDLTKLTANNITHAYTNAKTQFSFTYHHFHFYFSCLPSMLEYLSVEHSLSNILCASPPKSSSTNALVKKTKTKTKNVK